MDTLVPSFMRIQRGFATAQQVRSCIGTIEDQGRKTSLTHTDRLAVLDLPDDDDVASNISSRTALSRSALVARAVESPELLTMAELELLLARYWLDKTRAERKMRSNASDALIRISVAHKTAVFEQLRTLRLPLYEHEREGQALESVGVEMKQRFDAEAASHRDKRVQTTLSRFKGPNWARTLLEQEKGAKPWGFARYVDPLAIKHFDLEHYFTRADALLMFGRIKSGYGDQLSSAFHMQTLDWPGLHHATRDRPENIVQHIQSHDEQEFEEKEAARVYMASRQPDDLAALRTKFQLLREHFTSIRDRSRLPRYGGGDRTRYDALVDGVMSNAFIVIDSAAISSVYTTLQYADNIWVWAVDPDYDDPDDGFSCDSNSASPQYYGFLRVRLQQLADKFFEARKFRAEIPMSELWSASQNSRNGAFVSLDRKEQQAYRSDRMAGSALGKPKADKSTRS